MSLQDFYPEEIYLTEGQHEVEIRSIREFEYNSGSKGVEFAFLDERGETAKRDFCLHEKSLWKLALFAEACGLNEEERRRYDPNKPNSHEILVGRRIRIKVVEDGGYHKVVGWQSLEPGGRSFSERQISPNPASNGNAIDDGDMPF